MNCGRCGAAARFRPVMPPLPGVAALTIRSHAEAELWAYACGSCKKAYCGVCAFPKWQELKRRKGMSGPELAASLDEDPEAVFGEQPTCPSCASVLDDLEPPPAVPRSSRGCLVVLILAALAAGFWLVSRDRVQPPPPPATNR